MPNDSGPVWFVTLGMFIVDEFSFMDEDGQLTGGGTYAAIGARLWLPPDRLGMIVDRGHDFSPLIEAKLLEYGQEMWMFRDQPLCGTTRALNSYRGEHRGFKYITPRIRLTPKDLEGTKLAKPKILHFICSPSRASAIMSEVTGGWEPITIYEPIPDRCVPEELPALMNILPSITILSPNAEEALSLLSIPLPPTTESIERAANEFLEIGVGLEKQGWVIIRSGELGAYLKSVQTEGAWIDAYWTASDVEKIVDVTGAGNSFLGGLAAGMMLSNGDVYEAALHATVSASYTIEQEGLPRMSSTAIETWNGDSPSLRLEVLRKRHEERND
ncbi:Ribokinase-like protein [Crassisporium funariophilum]|nr:Ribokinase-like protein [Crassisporium funariophilum]